MLEPGTTESNFGVSPDGGAGYAVTLTAPPGTAGLEPKIRLTYSTRAGIGAAGMGWSIAGLSVVQRGSRNLSDDGEVRGIRFDEFDALLLDGEKLVEVRRNAVADWREYRSRIDSYARIRAYGWSAQGPERFVVESRAGLRMFYGTSNRDRVTTSSGRILSWLCDRIEDRSGNYMRFTYTLSGLEYQIAQVAYTGNDRTGVSPYATISFSYRSVEPMDVRYIGGERVSSTSLLAEIVTKFGARVLRRYRLVHQPVDPIRKAYALIEIHESGFDGLSYKPLTFTYSQPKAEWKEFAALGLPTELNLSELADTRAGFRLVDVNGDGKDDVIFRTKVGAETRAAAYIHNGTRWVKEPNWTPPVDLAFGGSPNRSVRTADVDGDGKTDLITQDSVYLARPGGWERHAALLPFNFVTSTGPDDGFFFVDLDPAAKNGQEIIWSSPQQGSGAAHFDGSRWVLIPRLTPPRPFSVGSGAPIAGVYLVDADCDGKDDLIYHRRRADGTVESAVYSSSASGWTLIGSTALNLPFDPPPNVQAVRFADLDGDGFRDVVVAYDEGGVRVQKAYLARKSGWIADPRPLPDIVFWANHAATNVWLVDVDGDGRADVIRGRSKNHPGFAFLGDPAGWVSSQDYAPPSRLRIQTDPFARGGQTASFDSGKKPQLVYFGGADLDPTQTVYTLSNNNKWTSSLPYGVPVQIAQFDKVDLGVRFPDLNGDGLADLAFTRKSGGTVTKYAYIYHPTGPVRWEPVDQFKIPVPTFSDDFKDTGVALADFNGDGLMDVLYSIRGADGQLHQALYVNCSQTLDCRGATGEGAFWKSVPLVGLEQEAFADETLGAQGARFTDLNGDGLTDVVISRRDPLTGAQHARAFINERTRFVEVPTLAPPIDFVRSLQADEQEGLGTKMRDNRVELIDVNGDRLPDLIYHFETLERDPLNSPPTLGPPKFKKTISKGAWLNRGDHWEFAPEYTPPIRIDSDDGRLDLQIYIEDLNRDGLPDLIYAERGKSATFLNTGAGWSASADAAYTIPDEAISTVRGDQGFRFLHINGDSLPDLAYSYALAADPSNPKKGTFLNTGTGWAKAPAEFDLPVALTEEHRGDLGVRPLDLDGNGIVDLIQSFQQEGGTAKDTAFLNRTPIPDLLIGVVNGLGVRTEISYRSLIGSDPTDDKTVSMYQQNRGSNYPIIDAPVPGQVVIGVSAAGPGVPLHRQTYAYAGYRLDTRSGRPLGFELQQVTDVERGRVTDIEYLQLDGVVGQTSLAKVMQGAMLVSSSRMKWEVKLQPGRPFANGFVPDILRPHLTTSVSKSWDLTGQLVGGETDEFSFDDYGNSSVVRTSYPDGSGSENRNSYFDDVEKWLLGRLSSSSVTVFGPGKPSETRVASFSYDSTSGLLIREASFEGTPFEVVTTHKRDSYGNKISSLTRGSGGLYREERLTYDPLGRFQLSSTNALGHQTDYRHDPLSGALIEQTEPNRSRTLYDYTSLQRIRAITSPARVTTSLRSSFTNGSIPSEVYVVTMTTASLPPTSTFFDASNRAVRTTSIGFRGKSVISRQQYDGLGRVVKIVPPHFEGDAEHATSRRFDSLDRIVEEYRPDGTKVSRKYQGLTTFSQNAKGQESATISDIRGRVRKSIDALRGVTEFWYDVNGRQTEVQNVLGGITRFEYDVAGHRKRITDPSAGQWDFKYNSFGDLIEQTDPRGSVVTLAYDSIGRRINRHSRDEDAAWVYDGSPTSIGQVSSSSTRLGSRESFTYDTVGRVSTATIEVGTDRVVVSQLYDGMGRATTRQYSTGVSVENRFDENGLPHEVAVRNGNDEVIAWSAERIDAEGRIVEERLGNGALRKRSFDPLNSRVRQLSVSVGGVPLQNLAVNYDELGNVKERIDTLALTTETFEYDDLSRLTKSTQAGRGSIALRYDSGGNILSKSGVGTYNYSQQAGANPVLGSVTGIDGKNLALVYDAAGNLTHRGDETIVFNADGRVSLVSRSSLAYSAFAYNAEGELVQHESRQGTTKFRSVFLGDIEILHEEFAPPLFPTPERTRIRHAISSPEGSVGYFEQTYWHYPMRQASPIYGDQVIDRPERTTRLTTALRYFVKDHLGSITGILDESGAFVDKFNYDPWGSRAGEDRRYVSLRNGFTEHDQLDSMGLVHMGGRVYDTYLGRFISADPFVQIPLHSQAYNRYAYAMNNPLRYIDPSGYDLWGDFTHAVGGFFGAVGNALGAILDAAVGKPLAWIGEQLNKAGRWLNENWRTVAVIAATIALSVLAPGIGPIAIGAIAGGLQGALYGGRVEDVLRGAVIGAVSGALAAGATEITGTANNFQTAFGQGVAGGMSAGLSGNDPGRGFLAALFGRLIVPGIENAPGAGYRIAAAAAVGGVEGELTGDTFENGAISGAMSRAFSEVAAWTQEGAGRPLTAKEKAVAKFATLGGLTDEQLDKVRVYDQLSPFQATAITPDGDIYWPGSAPADLTDAYIETFAHEVVHIMQLQTGSVLLRALPLQLGYYGSLHLYDPYMNLDQYRQTPSPNGLNVEAQADWYAHRFCTSQPGPICH
jgi:RHS repeat-associated protein